MGFFSGLKHAGNIVFNFRITKWMAVDQIKASTKNIYDISQSLFTPEQADRVETFEEALQRLGITEEQIQQRRKEFTWIMLVYMFVASVVFMYSIYIAIEYKNIMGALMGTAITIFALVQVFKYHFWIYQIKHRKLGCTLKEWFTDKP